MAPNNGSGSAEHIDREEAVLLALAHSQPPADGGRTFKAELPPDHPDYTPFDSRAAHEAQHQRALSEADAQKRIKKYAARRYPVTALKALTPKYPWAWVYANQLDREAATHDPVHELPKLWFTGDKVADKATDDELKELGPELTAEQVHALNLEAAAIRVADRTQVNERAKAIAAARHRDPDDDDTTNTAGPGGLFLDLGAVLDGETDRAVPTVLTRADGKSLFYKGKGNVIYGDPDTAKTWVALAAGAEVLTGGGLFVFLDLDHNGPETIAGRLRMFGVPVKVLRDPARFLYLDPLDCENVRAAVRELVKVNPDMVVIDSMGELLPMFGAGSNDSDEFTGVNREVVTPLSRAGAAVVVIDHMAKNAESRRHGAIGTFAKMRVVNGTMVRAFKVRPFIPGHGGVTSLMIHKDRTGNAIRETVASDAQDGEDGDDIKRDNLRRWGVFEMTSAPVIDRRTGQPVRDADGYAQERLSWSISPPKGIHADTEVDMPDPRNGGRPRGGVSVVGTEKYTAAVDSYLAVICRMKKEGHFTDRTTSAQAASSVASTLDTKISRNPWTEAWNRWTDADRPDSVRVVPALTPITDPFD